MDFKENGFIGKREPNEVMFIKEELTDDCSFIDSLCVKEEVASIYDEEEGYTLNVSFDNEEIKTEPGVFALCDSKAVSSLEHPVQIKNEKKESKLKAKGRVKVVQKANDCKTTKGRLSRDEIFKNKEYYCLLCEKSYLGRKCFKKHFKHHFTIEQNRYNCLICSHHTSLTVSHINRHILETHFLQDDDEKLFSCNLCEKRFHDKKDLERHIFSHTGEGALKCGECPYSCAVKHRLMEHIAAVHGYPRSPKAKADGSLFICDYCSYSSREKASLRSHIKRHIGYKSYECSECDYKCIARGDLQKHITIHSDRRPFVCDSCKKTFKRRSHLLIHFNGKHCRGSVKRKNRKSKVKSVI